jgi:SAM-dependent methyltransferase
MGVYQTMRDSIPAPLRPLLQRLKRAVTRIPSPKNHEQRVQAELSQFTAIEHVHDLPPIALYWANTYLIPILQPFGFSNSIEMFRTYIARACRERHDTCLILSIGAGDCAPEINVAQWLIENDIRNFTFECLDLNSAVLERARRHVTDKNLSDHFTFGTFDVNGWNFKQQYDIILAIQCLHHFVELELLFDKIHRALRDNGFLLTDDMIGRNGHQRWPEALEFVHSFWKELPPRYTYNHSLKRFEKEYENWDCSSEGFEGIRAQDILPLLTRKFHFDLFIGFGNIVDLFVDRAFGPNFDPAQEWDRDFIDRVHALDVREMESGHIKPTHMYAAMTKNPGAQRRFHKHLSPEFCIRHPDIGFTNRLRRLFSKT